VFKRQVYYLASVVFIVLGIVYFTACLQQPFVGLEIENINGQWIVTTSYPNGEGYKSGIEVGDEILRINGQDTGKYRIVQKWGEAEGASTIEFRRAGQMSDSIITINKRPVSLTVFSDIPMYILGLIFWFLGFITWYKRSFLVQAHTLFWLNWLIGLAIVLAQASSRCLLFARELECITFSLVPFFLIYFFSIFPMNNKNRLNRVGCRITIFMYLMILSLIVLQSVGIGNLMSLLRKLLLSNMIIGILFSLWNLSTIIKLPKDKPEKNQAGIILLGMVIGFLPIVLFTAVPIIFNFPQLVYAPVSSLFVSAIPVTWSYVIVNRYLPDSRELFVTIISYFIAGVIISLIVMYALFFLQIVQILNLEIYLAILFFSMLFIVCIHFVRFVMSNFLIKYNFFKAKQGNKQSIMGLNENLTSLFAEDRVLEEMVNKLRIEGAFIIVENAQIGCLIKAVGRFQEKQNEQAELEQFFHNVQNDQKIALEAEVLPDDFPAGIYVPFISHDSNCGIFFGRRYSRIKFEQTELSFFALLAGQIAYQLIMSLISESLLRKSQSVARIGSFIMDLKTLTWKASPELYVIAGIDEIYSHTAKGWNKLIHPDYRRKASDYFFQAEAEKAPYDYEYKIIRVKDEEERWVHVLGDFEFDNQGNMVRFIATVQDITKRKKAEEEILYLSYHDKLTGLYNRRFYEEEIKRLDTERNLPISIIIGDVNGLKLVNDAFGHNKGDELLRKAAAAIQSACRTDDIVARWGGDEFVILLPKTKTEEAEKIINRIKKQYLNEYVNGLSINISFGWDTKRKTDEDILEVLKSAEDHMYKHKIIENKSMRNNIISTILKTLHEKNPREELHSERVSEICQNIGRALGFSEIEINRLKVVGLLHDIGKIAIEEGILNKPGKLTEQEWNEIKRHPDIGYRILSTSYDMVELADCILAHHERWDGTGYPKGLKGEAIPRIARIIALADSYDAMTSERPYRKSLSEEEAIREILKNSGVQFDPEIVKIFLKNVLGIRQTSAYHLDA
jgi:two-component system sensor histidine kinase ComP